jgi:uncharacterized protein (TIGR02466 family)
LLKLAHVQNLFPVPLVSFQVDDSEALNNDLLAEIERRRQSEEGEVRSNRQGWHSAYDFFRRKEKAHVRLAAIIQEAVQQATMKLAPETQLSRLKIEYEGWINVNPTGAYNTPHDHPGHLWSGTYYVSTPAGPDGQDSSGRIEFFDSRGGLGDHYVRAPFTASKAGIRPKAGMLLMFPSNLLHWVHPNLAGEDRVTVAFNAKFTPKPGASAKRR